MCLSLPLSSKLQQGRAPLSAEVPPLGKRAETHAIASTGPRSFERGGLPERRAESARDSGFNRAALL